MVYYNTLIFLVLVLSNGGRHDWVYEVGSLALWLNAIPAVCSLVKNRFYVAERKRFYTLVGVIVGWGLFCLLYGYSLFNPSHWTIYNNLFSPLVVLENNPYLPGTPNPERSRLFLQFIIGLMWFSLAMWLRPLKRREVRASLALIFGTGVFLALVGGLMKLTGAVQFMWIIDFREPCAFGPFFYKNHWGAFAILSCGAGMGLIAGLYARERESGHFPERSVSCGMGVLLLLVSIPLSESRGATLLVLILLFGFVFSMLRELDRKSSAMLRVVGLVVFGGMAAIVYLLVAPQLERSLERSEQQMRAHREGDLREVKRLALYRDTFRLIEEKPIWGWGIGSFIHIHPIYAGPEFYEDGAAHPVAFEFAHSDYLQCLAEFGFVGSALFFFPFILLVWRAWKERSLRSRLGPWPMVSAGLVALSASFDFTLSSPALAIGMLLLGLMGLRVGESSGTSLMRSGVTDVRN